MEYTSLTNETKGGIEWKRITVKETNERTLKITVKINGQTI